MKARIKNFYKQKEIGLIANCNLEVHHLGTKKSNLNNKGNNKDLYTSKFENIQVIGDRNISIEDNNMRHFCEGFHLKSLIKVPSTA